MSDFRSQIEGERGKLKELLLQVPGFKGYIEMEDRRTADKLLRETVADRYQEVVDRLSGVQSNLVDQGALEWLDDLETVVVKLRTFIDRIRHATYGYSSFFSAVKVDAAKLDKIYEYDLALLDGISGLEALLGELEEAGEELQISETIADLKKLAAEIVKRGDQRSEVITKE
jgi:hypothetical protein